MFLITFFWGGEGLVWSGIPECRSTRNRRLTPYCDELKVLTNGRIGRPVDEWLVQFVLPGFAGSM